MSELRTDFKDEILQEGETHRVYNIKRKGTDEVVESEVYLEKAYEALQEGDEFGAKDVNEIHVRLNGLASMNLLINSDFRNPINQRGETSYWKPSSWTYNVDRWTHIYNSVILEDGYIRIYNDSGETGTTFFKQIFERPLEQNDYTVTVNVKEINGIVQVEGLGTLVKGLNVFTIKNTSLHQLQLNLVGESSVELYCIKLEQGSVATPLVPRPYAEEIALCKRYFDMITGIRAIGVESNTGLKKFTYMIPRTSVMRTTPTITIGGNVIENSESGICVRECENCVKYTGLSFTYEVGTRELLIVAHFNGSLPSKKPNETQIFINDNFYIYLDAEIY